MESLKPLLIEHELIIRMMKLLNVAFSGIQTPGELDPEFVATVVDFFRIYANRTHEWKEEEILFRTLAGKKMSREHEALMYELVEEHCYARSLTSTLVVARNAYIHGEVEALGQVVSAMMSLTEFYFHHVEKEDHVFFPIALTYLSAEARVNLYERFAEFDRNMIHEKYVGVIRMLEAQQREQIGRQPAHAMV